jgi:D-ribose pyranase
VLIGGILNPNVLSLLARVRHTNALVIADRGFPSWGPLETIDLSLVDNIPRVLDVVNALRGHGTFDQVFMAEEFLRENSAQTKAAFESALDGVPITFEPHVEFKKRVPGAVGLIRTGDTTQYANMILISG